MTICAARMASIAAGVACCPSPGPIPTTERTPALDMRALLSRQVRNSRHCQGHGPSCAGLRVRLFLDEKLTGAGGKKRCWLADASSSDVTFHRLRWRWHVDCVQGGRWERFHGPSMFGAEREERGLVRLHVDGCNSFHRS